MKNKQKLFIVSCVYAILICANTLSAKTEQYSFDVFLWGLKVGELVYSIKKEYNQYDISGILRSKGFARVVTKYKFVAQTQGRLSKSKYYPSSYSEKSDTGRRKEEKSIVYHKMIPKITSAKAPKPHWAQPKSQKGTVDPMTAIHLVMGDRIEKALCTQKINLFDGARRIEIILSKINIQKNSAQCRGEYIRQDGYTDEEMKEGKIFPFTINYIKRNEIYAVESLEIKALRGRTKFTRR
jgi:hypothetical protein